MNKKTRLVLTVVLAAVLVVSGGYILWRDMDRNAGKETYVEAEELAGIPDLSALTPAPAPTPVPSGAEPTEEPTAAPDPTPEPTLSPEQLFAALKNTNLEALRARNSEVLGWIAIPNTLSYPLMRGKDNSYYLDHTWKGTSSAVGAVFMDCRNDAAMTDANTLIYGHRTIGNAMFGSLRFYSSYNYWASHPDVYVVTDDGIARYRIYAAYEAEVTSDTYVRQFSSDEQKQEFIDHGLARSAIDTGVRPGVEDRIVTLSTCTARGSRDTRWVVQAVYMEQAEGIASLDG